MADDDQEPSLDPFDDIGERAKKVADDKIAENQEKINKDEEEKKD
jgi:hypothetical protein